MDDDELIAALAAGDETALRELFVRHAPWLAGRLRAALPPPDVEDVLQETFLAVWKGASGYRPRGTPHRSKKPRTPTWTPPKPPSSAPTSPPLSTARKDLVLARNVIGITGIGLLCSLFTGGLFAWTLPMGYMAFCRYALLEAWTAPWTWPVRCPAAPECGQRGVHHLIRSRTPPGHELRTSGVEESGVGTIGAHGKDRHPRVACLDMQRFAE